MIAILVGTAVCVVLSFVVGKCDLDRGKPTKARFHWNAPQQNMARKASLADLLGQATVRAGKLVPGAQLVRMNGRQLDATGLVDVDYGAAGFEYIAPADAKPGTPCGVEEGLAWQGWTQRVRNACDDVPLAPRCTFAAAVAKGFQAPPAALQFVLESDSGAATWTFWPLDPAGPAVTVPDDCAPQP
jgi:hypothetical protein